MLLIVIDVTFLILFIVPVVGICSARKRNQYSKETSEKESSSKRSKRAIPLEPEELIPIPEGCEKNPDVKEMIKERSQKTEVTMVRNPEMKGFVLENNTSVRRLEDGSKYEIKTNERFKRSDAPVQKPKEKSSRSSKESKKSSKESKKSDRSKSSKKEQSAKSDKTVEKKKSSIREKKRVEVPEVKEKPKHVDANEVKTKKLQKARKPWKGLFKLKRRKTRNDVHVAERTGTWA